MRKIAALALAGVLAFGTPSFAGHVKVPPYKDRKPVEAREVDRYCDEKNRKNRIEFEVYDVFKNNKIDDTIVFYLDNEKVPFAIYVVLGDPKNQKDFPNNTVWYDLDRDDHVDGKARPQQKPVGDNPCDMVPNLKKKKK